MESSSSRLIGLQGLLERNLQLQQALQIRRDSLCETLGGLCDLHCVLQQASQFSLDEDIRTDRQSTSRKSARSGHVVRVVVRSSSSLHHHQGNTGTHENPSSSSSALIGRCYTGHLDNTQQFSLLARTSLVALHRVDDHHGRDFGGEPHLRNAVEEHAQRADAFAYAYLIVPQQADPSQIVNAATTQTTRRVTITTITSIAASTIVAMGPPLGDDDRKQRSTNLVFPRITPMSCYRHQWDTAFDQALLRLLIAYATAEAEVDGDESMTTVSERRKPASPAAAAVVTTKAMRRVADMLTMQGWTRIAQEMSQLHFRHRKCLSITTPAQNLHHHHHHSEEDHSVFRFDGNTTALPVSASCCRHRWHARMRSVVESFETSLRSADESASLFLETFATARDGGGADASTVASSSYRWSPELDDSLHSHLIHKCGYLVCRPVWESLVSELTSVAHDPTAASTSAVAAHPQRHRRTLAKQEPQEGDAPHHYEGTKVMVGDLKGNGLSEEKRMFLQHMHVILLPRLNAFEIASHFQRTMNPYHVTTSTESSRRHSGILRAMRDRVTTQQRFEMSSGVVSPSQQRMLRLLDDAALLTPPSSGFSIDEDTRLLWCANELTRCHGIIPSPSSAAGDDKDNVTEESESRVGTTSRTITSSADLTLAFYFRTLAKTSLPFEPSEEDSSCISAGSWGASPFYYPGVSFRTAAQISHRWAALAPPTTAVSITEESGGGGGVRGIEDQLSEGHVTPLLPLHVSANFTIPVPLIERTWSETRIRFLSMFALCTLRQVQSQVRWRFLSMFALCTLRQVQSQVRWRGDVSFVERYVLEGTVPHERLRTISRYQFTTRLHQFTNSVAVESRLVFRAPASDEVNGTDEVATVPSARSEPAPDESSAFALEVEEREGGAEVPSSSQNMHRRRPPPAAAMWTPSLDTFLLSIVDRVQVPWRFEITPTRGEKTASQQQRHMALTLQPTVDDGECWWRYVARLVEDVAARSYAPTTQRSTDHNNSSSGNGEPHDVFTSMQCYLRFSKLRLPPTATDDEELQQQKRRRGQSHSRVRLTSR
ncbi:Hypothetical protein, putative [Bodo saltans]|uniref:Uncharacterized protein n=1 Tax=Bodo saltans TaxID=75058 RepID=A0A0S4JR67_BODSA|nr:Hypothetical protein, putative [Bodo saltans]|eukprot:CUG92686.1 Hypothetical protein, putative [Bodo saltans]